MISLWCLVGQHGFHSPYHYFSMQIALTRPLVIVHVFVVLSLCMTRPTLDDLISFDPEINRTFYRLHRHDRNTNL